MNRIVSALVVAGTLGIVSSAFAAELPLKAPAYRAPVYTWTGCYLGVNVGGGWGHKDNIDLSPPQPVALPLGSHDVRGPVAGGQLGCDYQVGGLVFGVQGMFDWADLSGGNTDPSDPTGDLAFKTESNWFATLTGRLGYAVQPNLLI
jgi:outer membrane immunogenic protein